MTGTLGHLLAACLFFVASHVLVTSTPLRGVLIGRLGDKPYLGLYSVVSLLALIWMGAAYGAAPHLPWWDLGTFGRHQTLGVMLIVCLFLVAGVTSPNPTQVGVERISAAGPAGIVRITRHPVMWATGLWALSHLIANGDAASVIFFGTFAVLALGGTLLIERRKRISLGDAWPPFAAATSNIPFAAIIAGRAGVSLGDIGYGRLAGGVALFAALMAVHGLAFGVSSMPF